MTELEPKGPVLSPDSVMVRTATELLLAHSPGQGGPAGEACPRCGIAYPCPPATRARLVRYAAGLYEDPSPDEVAGLEQDALAVVPTQSVPGRRVRGTAPAGWAAHTRTPHVESTQQEEAAAATP